MFFTLMPAWILGRWRSVALFCAVMLSVYACSADGDEGDSHPQDAAAESSGEAEAGISVDLCTEIGPDKVQTIAIPDAYAQSVLADCRVSHLFLPLGPVDGTAFLDRLRLWTEAFFGCPNKPEGVTNFGPADTGKNPTLTQADVDVLSQHYVEQLTLFLKLTDAQLAVVNNALAPLAAAAVNSPGAGHSLSFCVDSGIEAGNDTEPDALGDSSLDGGVDAFPEAGD